MKEIEIKARIENIETVYEKGSGKVNEDSLLVGENIFGVFDGATSLTGFTDEQGRTGAAIASQLAKDVFSQNDEELSVLAEKANVLIRKEMVENGIDISQKVNLWMTSVAVVKIKDKMMEWVQISDSLILLIYKDGSFKLLINDYDHDQESLLAWRELADKKTENIRSVIYDLIVKNRNRANVEYGFLNGENDAMKFLKTGKESLENVSDIILFTDGLIIPKEDPTQEDDFELFLRLYSEGGLEKIKSYVRELEDGDPNCWTYARFKQYDDISAISITI